MNVSELFGLTEWVSREIEKPGIVKKYQDLHAILNKNAQPNQQKTPFSSQHTVLTEALKSVPLASLTKDQLLFLRDLGIADAVGPEGVEQLEDILYKNSLDIATATQKLSEIFNRLSNGIGKSNNIKVGLTGCVVEEEYEADGEILMRVSFAGNAAMSNVTDFKKWGNSWYEIGRGIAMAHDAAPEDVKIIGATKGSVILELAVVAGIATTVSGIILSALKVAEKVLEIQKKAEELRGLKLSNKLLAGEVDAAAGAEKETGIKKIITATLKQIGLAETTDKGITNGDKVSALKKAVTNLVDFIEFGGEVDFIIPDEETEGNEDNSVTPKYGNLRVCFQEIRQLESKLKLLNPADEQ
jgi:hypothetical protein